MSGVIFVTIIPYKKTLWLLIVLVQVVYGVDISEKKHLSEACNKGNIKACFQFAEFYYTGIYNGVYDKNYYKIVVEPYHKSCKKRIAKACYRLGEMYIFKRGVSRNLIKGYQLQEKSCSLGLAIGCSMMGIWYEEEFFLPQDYKKSLKFYEKACTLTKSISNCRDRDRLLLKINGSKASSK